MRFCPNCSNMLYLNVNGTNLIYRCKNCAYEITEDESHKCVYENNYNNTYVAHEVVSNRYTKYDPTLPRLTNMKCINDNCISNSNHENIIIVSNIKSLKKQNLIDKYSNIEHTIIDLDTETFLVKPKNNNELDKIYLLSLDDEFIVKKMNKIESEIIFIKYDPSELKYVYICTYCNTSWKNHK